MTAPENKKDDGLSDTARDMRKAQPYMDAVWKFVGGIVVGTLGGYFLDRFAHTSPWGILGLAALGTAVGLFAFIRDMNRMGRK